MGKIPFTARLDVAVSRKLENWAQEANCSKSEVVFKALREMERSDKIDRICEKLIAIDMDIQDSSCRIVLLEELNFGLINIHVQLLDLLDQEDPSRRQRLYETLGRSLQGKNSFVKRIGFPAAPRRKKDA